jgi:alkylhydroperoxidase family enzyme
MPQPIEYADASPAVRAVYDDIKRAPGMSEAMFAEVMAVTSMANETNRLLNGYRVPIDAAYNT